MKSRIEEQKLTQVQTKAKQPRFRIEKLEERIAPRAHYNPHGKYVGNDGGSRHYCRRGYCYR